MRIHVDACPRAPEALARVELDATELTERHPPTFHDRRKRMLLEMVGMQQNGALKVSRWRGDLPASFELPPRPHFDMREDVFSYPPEEPRTVEWHLNFADSELFVAYGSSLLAQDEHQVLEHPALGSVREALVALCKTRPELAPRTRTEEPTPYLIRGVERRLALDTRDGLYGNAFSAAEDARIIRAARRINPPTLSNILAMEAPVGGAGRYAAAEIYDVLRTAWIGFGAAKLVSAPSRVTVHTGNWGCGAYGGSRVLMALLQLCAAQLARLDRLVFHTFSSAFSEAYRRALSLLDDVLPPSLIVTEEVVARVAALGFEWGTSDGN